MGSLEHNKQLVARLKHTQIPHYKCYNAGSESLGVISTYRVTDAQLISRSGGNIIVGLLVESARRKTVDRGELPPSFQRVDL